MYNEGRGPKWEGRAEALTFVDLPKAVPIDGRDRVFVLGGGGGPIDGRPLILRRDFALEFDVRAVVAGVAVRGEDWPELVS